MRIKVVFKRCWQQGSTIAETGASMAIMIPLIMVMLFVVVEATRAYTIREALAQGSRQAARELAVQYGVNPAIATSRTLQNSLVFDNIRVNNIINSSNQFSNPVWNTAAIPPTVAVTATYTSNQNGLPPFPNPDPLHLSNSFVINASSTYRIE